MTWLSPNGPSAHQKTDREDASTPVIPRNWKHGPTLNPTAFSNDRDLSRTHSPIQQINQAPTQAHLGPLSPLPNLPNPHAIWPPNALRVIREETSRLRRSLTPSIKIRNNFATESACQSASTLLPTTKQTSDAAAKLHPL